MAAAIQAKGLGKRYVIRHERQNGYTTLREILADTIRGVGRKPAASREESFWALRDVDLSIEAGERVGIIGRNGAGKSTLLKLMSRITDPTEGQVRIRGRVASLLEVGTGFHPELSGRENIFLNGAILGMSRQEIRSSFDEIVEYAEIARFLDTPVKRYSSGMHMRLAFSVAAHLRSEILLVDEVLAVGDIGFQKKCLSKLSDIGAHGRTIVFVSHNLSQVRRLCSRGIVVDGGALDYEGDVESAISHYVSLSTVADEHEWRPGGATDDPGEGVVRPRAMRVVDAAGAATARIDRASGAAAYIEIEFELPAVVEDLTLGYSLFDEQGNHLYRCLQSDAEARDRPRLRVGRNVLRSRLPAEWLNEGRFTVVLDGSIYKKRWLFNPVEQNRIAVSFDLYGRDSASEYWQSRRMGLMAPLISWSQLAEE